MVIIFSGALGGGGGEWWGWGAVASLHQGPSIKYDIT